MDTLHWFLAGATFFSMAFAFYLFLWAQHWKREAARGYKAVQNAIKPLNECQVENSRLVQLCEKNGINPAKAL